jgi:hypothetical protein
MEDGEDTENGDDDGAEDAPSQGPAKSPAPARPMRQLTLIELCKPFQGR